VNNKRKAFTLIEIMIVIVILGLLAAVASVGVLSNIDKAKRETTRASLKALHSAVLSYYMDVQRYPTEEEGLNALVEKPVDADNWRPEGYIETTTVPKDGWGRDFIYELNPASGKAFQIKSLGADGEEGGEGYNADLLDSDAN
jgi:general secretion pathway protein G